MKLIKINNANEISGRFTNTFNDPIILEPNSQIALLNCNLDISTKNIVVNEGNRSFKVNISSTIQRDVTLQVGTYDWVEFRIELQRALNACLEFVGVSAINYMTGFQWKVWKKASKLYIGFDRSSIAGYGMDNLCTISDLVYAVPIWTKGNIAANQDKWTGYTETNRYFIKGCGFIAAFTICPASNMTDPEFANYRLLVGLRSVEGLLINDDERRPEDCDYAIYTSQNQTNTDVVYYIRRKTENGYSNEPTAISVRNGHEVSIVVTDGNINFQVVNSVSAVVLDENYPVNGEFYDTHHYAVVSLARNDSQARKLSVHTDPFHKITIDEPENYYHDSLIEYNGSPTLGALPTSQVRLTMSTAVRNLLSFNQDPQPITRTRGTFESDKNIKEIYLPDSIKIELDNINLDSYDSYSKSKRNILACIPKIQYTNDSSGDITYQTDYPLFLDINNTKRIILNNIKVSILNYKDEYQLLSPNTTDITLIIK